MLEEVANSGGSEMGRGRTMRRLQKGCGNAAEIAGKSLGRTLTAVCKYVKLRTISKCREEEQ